jgi:hypothetical protein
MKKTALSFAAGLVLALVSTSTAMIRSQVIQVDAPADVPLPSKVLQSAALQQAWDEVQCVFERAMAAELPPGDQLYETYEHFRHLQALGMRNPMRLLRSNGMAEIDGVILSRSSSTRRKQRRSVVWKAKHSLAGTTKGTPKFYITAQTPGLMRFFSAFTTHEDSPCPVNGGGAKLAIQCLVIPLYII